MNIISLLKRLFSRSKPEQRVTFNDPLAALIESAETNACPIEYRIAAQKALMHAIQTQNVADMEQVFDLLHKGDLLNGPKFNMTQTYLDSIRAQAMGVYKVLNDLQRHFEALSLHSDSPQKKGFRPDWLVSGDLGAQNGPFDF